MLLPFVLGLIACGVGAYFAFPQAVSQFLINLQRKAAGLTTKTVTVDHHNIVYLEGGQGDPLLLIHGFGADCDAWPRMAAHLNSRFHLVIPDLPGFGGSSRIPTARYGLDEQLARLAAFCKAVGLKKFHIAGNSMGGYLAAHYAARYPEQISSLWLLAPAGVAGADKSDLQAMLAEARAEEQQ
jgi:pimeloyl-ACP methyl ester carboxylesterase